MERINVGIIGCGGIAQYHFGHFDKLQDKMRLAAACDILPERAAKTVERYPGAVAYTDYRDMFEREKLDAVFVCVQPGAHDGMEFIAIDKGIHLFCQKPMSLDLDYARNVCAGLQKNRLLSAVGLQCRYVDTLPFIRDFVRHKLEQGDLAQLSAYRIGGFPLVWWWRNMEQSGGQAVEMTIHNFDMLRYVFGDVAQVSAVRRRGVIRHIDNNTVDDASSTLITFKNGLIGTFNTGCYARDFGEDGIHAFYCNADGNNGKLTFSIGGNYTIREKSRTISGSAANDCGLECDETFIDAVRGELPADEILTAYPEALKTLEFVLAINASMDQNGAPVTFD